MADAQFAALEPKADALVRISAVVALGAPEALCRSAIARHSKWVRVMKTSSQR